MNKPSTLGAILFVLFGSMTALCVSLEHGLWIGIPCGIIAGLLIALLFLLPIFIYRKKFLTIKAQVQNEVTVILDGEANYYNYSRQGIGGWLFLTDNELIFKHYHALFSGKWWKDKQLQTITIPLTAIAKTSHIEFLNAKRVILILHNQQQPQVFAVYDRALWLKKINERLVQLV